jgi:hypothetical protein
MAHHVIKVRGIENNKIELVILFRLELNAKDHYSGNCQETYQQVLEGLY